MQVLPCTTRHAALSSLCSDLLSFSPDDWEKALPYYEELLHMKCQRLGWEELELPLPLSYDRHVHTLGPQLQSPHTQPGTFKATWV